MEYDLTNEVKTIGSLNFEGNIIPMEWFNHLKLDNGKPDTISILILSDIVYWYRPTIIRDEIAGRVIGYKKKFKADILQRSYSDFESLLGFSEKQTREALIRLEKKNLLERVFRHINVSGKTIANVMFIKINPQVISSITNKFEEGVSIKGNTSFPTEKHMVPFGETHGSLDVNTNTETTTEITTNNSLSRTYSKKIEERESKLISIWNSTVEKKLGRETKVTSKRITLLNRNLSNFFNNDIILWESFCIHITKSKFLMGEITDFRIQLDWILKEDNLIKVIEGSYHREGENTQFSDSLSENDEEKLIVQIKKSNYPDFWKEIMINLLKKIGYSTFNAWVSKNEFISYKNGLLEIKAPSKFSANWQTENFLNAIFEESKKTISDIKECIIKY